MAYNLKMTSWEYGFDSWVRSCINSDNLKIYQNTVKGYQLTKKNGYYDLFYSFILFRCVKVWNMFITFV